MADSIIEKIGTDNVKITRYEPNVQKYSRATLVAKEQELITKLNEVKAMLAELDK